MSLAPNARRSSSVIPAEPPSKSGVKMLSKFAWLTMRRRGIAPVFCASAASSCCIELNRWGARPHMSWYCLACSRKPCPPCCEMNVSVGTWSGSPKRCTVFASRRALTRAGLPRVAAVAAALASRSTVGVASTAPPSRACATCASSCARSQRPRQVAGLYFPCPKTTWEPMVYACARRSRAAAAAAASSWIRTPPRSSPRRGSKYSRTSESSGRPGVAGTPPDRRTGDCWTTCASSCASSCFPPGPRGS